MKHRKLWMNLTLLATLAVAGLIFFFSAQKADNSTEMSAGIVARVVRALFANFEGLSAERQAALVDGVTFAVRKLAHFSLFALLGLCLAAHLRLRRWEAPAKSTARMSWALATLYACTDEAHQLFVEGRSAELRDVAIDSAGALCGVLLLALVWRLAARRLARR